MVFRCRLNPALMWHSRFSAGRAFKIDGAATLEARVPDWCWFDEGCYDLAWNMISLISAQR